MYNIYKIILKSQVILFVSLLIIIIFVFSNEVTSGIKNGFLLCFEVLIPSLFPFMVISSFMSNYNFYTKINKIFAPFTKLFFNLPGCTAATIFLGLVGGYPTGAVGISNLLKNKLISEAQAKRMLLFLVNAGPAFVITAIGTRTLHNKNLGIIIFLSQTLAAILLGILTKFLFKDSYNIKSKYNIRMSSNFSDIFVKSVKTTSQNMFNMCAFVVLFSSFLEIIKNNLLYKHITNVFNFIGINNNIGISSILSFFEVTKGCYSIYKYKAPLGLLIFFLSFGGICVHLQIFSCFDKVIFSKLKFIFFRILHGILSSIIFYIILSFFNYSVQTFNPFITEDIVYDFASSGLAIIFLSLCFLITLTSDNINFKKE